MNLNSEIKITFVHRVTFSTAVAVHDPKPLPCFLLFYLFFHITHIFNNSVFYCIIVNACNKSNDILFTQPPKFF